MNAGLYLQSFINILYTFPTNQNFLLNKTVKSPFSGHHQDQKRVCYKEVALGKDWDFSRLRNGKK